VTNGNHGLWNERAPSPVAAMSGNVRWTTHQQRHRGVLLSRTFAGVPERLMRTRNQWLFLTTFVVSLSLACAGAPDKAPSPEDFGDAGEEGPVDDAGEEDAGLAANDGGRSIDGGSDASRADAGLLPDAGAALIQCGMMLQGPALNPRLTEAKPGYFDELNALPLPATVDFSKETKFQLAVVRYMLQRNDTNTVLTREEVERSGPLGKAVLGAAAKSTRPGEVDLTFLRRGLYAFYPCATQFPLTLDEFKQRYGDYTQWSREDVACGTAKNAPRRLWENDALGIYVAETLAPEGVRETEVLFTNRRRDRQIEFAVYTDTGVLSDRSTFPTGAAGTQVMASPYACMACHYDDGKQSLTAIRPIGTGTGCRPQRDGGAPLDGGTIAPDAGAATDGGSSAP
jgi:hypothetical protein